MQVDTINPSLSNSMPMDPLNATDSSLCTCHLSSLACLTLVCSDRLAVLFGANACVLASYTFCLSHSVDSLPLSHTVRSPLLRPSHRTLKSFSTCKIEMHVYLCFCSFNLNFQYKLWPHIRQQTDRQTYTRILQCSPASVGLAQAHPKYIFRI